MPTKRIGVYQAQERRFLVIFVAIAATAAAVLIFVYATSLQELRESGQSADSAGGISTQRASSGHPADSQPPPSEQPPIAGNVLIAGNKTYALSSGTSTQDERTLAALRTNCYNAARNNASGQYPAIQRQACNDYIAQANRMGIQIGEVPAVRVASTQAYREPVVVAGSSKSKNSACPQLYAAKHSIEDRMRRPYSAAEGNRLNERMRSIEKELWDLRCTETGFD